MQFEGFVSTDDSTAMYCGNCHTTFSRDDRCRCSRLELVWGEVRSAVVLWIFWLMLAVPLGIAAMHGSLFPWYMLLSLACG